jgi:plastocyanin
MVTQYNAGNDGSQTVQACPTGQTNYDCMEAVYDHTGSLSTVHVINCAVTKDSNGAATTITVTKTDSPQITPAAKLDVDANGNGDSSGSDEIVTDWVDVTTTSTSTSTALNGKKSTITETHTHSTMVIATTGSASNAKPTHKVAVGKDGQMQFQPATVSASAGDVVRFTFFPRNHSVTTCDKTDPCIENNGFDSGTKFTFISNSTTFIDYPVADSASATFFYR